MPPEDFSLVPHLPMWNRYINPIQPNHSKYHRNTYKQNTPYQEIWSEGDNTPRSTSPDVEQITQSIIQFQITHKYNIHYRCSISGDMEQGAVIK